MVNTFYDSYRILMHVYSEKTFIKQAINSEVIEPINKNTVIKIVYGVVENDIHLEYLLSKLCSKRPKLPVRVLLKIAIYCIKFLNKAPYAVTDSAVELCKKLGKGGMSGFLNATLRTFIKKPDFDYPKDEKQAISIKYSYPIFAVNEIVNDYGLEKATQIMAYDKDYNYLRFKKGVDGEKYLKNNNISYTETIFDNCFSVKNFTRDDGYYNGDYTFQSIGSVAICDIVETGDKILDCCAGPGGKTVLLAEKFNNVVASELHEHRANLILEYAQRMKVENVQISCEDSTRYNANYDSSFDAVLCDSPCSGFGVIKENPDIKLNREEVNLFELNELQYKILSNVSRYVKEGGSLYYSTCSIFKRENDLIIEKFLKNNNGFKVEEIGSNLNHMPTKYGIQFLPDISFGAGFYISKLRKLWKIFMI